ncbi:MAG: hypothetical protein IV092_08400 [Burkholderiaceae bacterium]|nr:hypothetical protein [Burkholderiaceae bacterium]
MGRQQGQQGMSLVGLMVGMAISLLAILGALSLHKTASRTLFGAGGLVVSANQDGQLASGLLTAQIALQGAGFGLAAPAANSQLLLLTGASFDSETFKLLGTKADINATAQDGNAVVWVQNPGLSADAGQHRCMALLSEPETKAFYLLQSNGACQPLANQWSQITWKRQTLVGAGLLGQPVGLSALNAGACWPYGALPEAIAKIAPPSAAVSVSLSYASSVTGSGNTYTSCLANLSS